jgi:hypothetical protein
MSGTAPGTRRPARRPLRGVRHGARGVRHGAPRRPSVARALAAQPAEVARYRAGEKKLLGVLVGAAMREARGAADAAAVRQVLLEKLGEPAVPRP